MNDQLVEAVVFMFAVSFFGGIFCGWQMGKMSAYFIFRREGRLKY